MICCCFKIDIYLYTLISIHIKFEVNLWHCTRVHGIRCLCDNPGDLVYLKCEGSKHKAQHCYIVTACDSEFVTRNKLMGSKFCSNGYNSTLRYDEVYKVPCVQWPKCYTKDTYLDDSRWFTYMPKDNESENETQIDSSDESSDNDEPHHGLCNIICDHQK